MVNYISIVSRSDFSDLYKFGHLFIHNLIPFEGDLNEHFEDKPLFDAVTRYMNTYEYSTEYLLLHINRTVFAGSVAEIFIKDVYAVYALDSESQASLSVSLDPRINIQVSCWEPFFKDLNKKQLIRQANSGKFNCYEIFGIADIDRDKIANFVSRDFLNELFSDLFENKRPNGKKSIWTYLLRYDRHGAFWKDNRGYFSDAMNVFENYLNEKEISYEWDDELKFADIIENNGTKFSDICRILTSKVTPDYKVPGCNYFAVAPLFLYMKNYFGDKGITPSLFTQNDLFSKGTLYEIFGFDFALAVALLGIKFGHDLTYGCYYEIKNLGIFNRRTITEAVKTKITDPRTGKNLSIDEAQELIDTLSFDVEILKDEIRKQKESVDNKKESDRQAIANEEMVGKENSEAISEGQGKSLIEDSTEAVSEEKAESVTEDNIETTSEGQGKNLKEDSAEAVSEEKTESATEENIETTSEGPTESNTLNESSIEKKEQTSPILESRINHKDNDDSIFECVWMRKLTKDRKKFNSKVPARYAHNKVEFDDFLKDNWVPENYFDSFLK